MILDAIKCQPALSVGTLILITHMLGGCSAGEGDSESGDIALRTFADYTERLAIVGDDLYLLNGEKASRYALINAQDQSSMLPTSKDTISFSGRTFGIRSFADGFVAAGSDGMNVYEFNDDIPRIVGEISFGTGSHTASFKESFAYVASRDDTKIPKFLASELKTVDLTHPEFPVVVNSTLLHYPLSVVRANDGLLVCDSEGGMKYFSLATPSSPTSEEVIAQNISSGQCKLHSNGSTVFRLQPQGIDKLEWQNGQLTRISRAEFGRF